MGSNYWLHLVYVFIKILLTARLWNFHSVRISYVTTSLHLQQCSEKGACYGSMFIGRFCNKALFSFTNGIIYIDRQTWLQLQLQLQFQLQLTAAVAQWLRASVPQAEGWEFESKTRQTQVVKTGNDSTTAKRSVSGVSVWDDHYKRMPLITVGVAR